MSEHGSYALFVSGTGTVLLAFAALVIAALVPSLASIRRLAHAPVDGTATMRENEVPRALEHYGTALSRLGVAMLLASLLTRGLEAGYFPLSNMYDFSIALAAGILVATHVVAVRYRTKALSWVLIPVAGGLLVYAGTVSPALRPRVPALQAPELLTLHVSVAIVAYSCFAVGFGAAVLHLIRQRLPQMLSERLPSQAQLDEIGYFSAALGFAFMSLVLTIGAYWANQAWGRHWGWDPKESAALATWLIYAAYLHAHPHRRAASQWMLVLGFCAVLLTYFGNLFLRGLHAYA